MNPNEPRNLKKGVDNSGTENGTPDLSHVSEIGTGGNHSPSLIRSALETIGRGFQMLARTFDPVGVFSRPTVRVEPLSGPDPQRESTHTELPEDRGYDPSAWLDEEPDPLPELDDDEHIPEYDRQGLREWATVYPGHFGVVFWDATQGLRSDPTIQSDYTVDLEAYR